MSTDLPVVVPRPDLPAEVTIWEVGPRDGLQNESVSLPVDVKLEFISRLSSAGLRVVEATSFVRPDRVPQMADAAEVMTGLGSDRGSRYPVLVPNLSGLDRALRAGSRDVAVFASATDTFARRNLNRDLVDQTSMIAPVVAEARSAGCKVRGYISMCFGDPWEGPVPVEQVAMVCEQLAAAGCDALSLGDTIGVATPGQVREVLAEVFGTVRDLEIGVHFHDTYGQALANTLAALEQGTTVVDSSAGGLGGCPYAKSATGNLATEDLVWMLDGLGIRTGADLLELVATSRWLADKLGRPSPSRVVQALGQQ